MRGEMVATNIIAVSGELAKFGTQHSEEDALEGCWGCIAWNPHGRSGAEVLWTEVGAKRS